ncbi:MAG: hypothetical protein ABI598_02310 [Chloroflexota bacterium]
MVSRAAPAVGLVLLLLAACTPGGTAAPLIVASPPPSATTPSTSSADANPSASPGAAAPVAIDPSLLSVLPATVDGLEVTESVEAETTALADPELSTIGLALAAGIAVDGPTGQFVYAVVISLKPGAMTDAAFGALRAAYDEGACSQADGIAAQGETQIAGRKVYTGTCVGGLRTYHVWLGSQDVVIAASALGDRLLGERLLEGVRP